LTSVAHNPISIQNDIGELANHVVYLNTVAGCRIRRDRAR